MKKNAVKIFTLCFLLVFAAGMFAACRRSGGTPPPKGTRVVALDNVSLTVLDRLGVDTVIGVPSSGWERAGEKYGDRQRYIDAGIPMQPNYTDIALANPSEVIMSDATEKAFGNIKSSFEALGIPVRLFDYNGIPELKKSIVKIGEYFESKEKAQEIVAELERGEREILEGVAALSAKPRVLALFGAPLGSPSQSISIAGSGLYAGSIVGYIGAVNVIDELYPGGQGLIKPDNWAPILDLKPDYIFCTAHGRPDEVWDMYDSSWDSSPWNLFDAVRNRRIYYLPEDKLGVIAEFDYVSAMRYILDIFEGKISGSVGG